MVLAMENVGRTRVPVSSIAWLGGGRCRQRARGAKASEEKRRRCMSRIEPQLRKKREVEIHAEQNKQLPLPDEGDGEDDDASDDETDCEPHKRTGIRENREATSVAAWTATDVRQTEGASRKNDDCGHSDPFSGIHGGTNAQNHLTRTKMSYG